MELKFWKWIQLNIWNLRFNRTFMELKFMTALDFNDRGQVLIVPLWNWNNTLSHHEQDEYEVLIVPLWNWNDNAAKASLQATRGFNRTFMELKLGCSVRKALLLPTFMELKCRFSRSFSWYSAVLIVPLWNWNVVSE